MPAPYSVDVSGVKFEGRQEILAKIGPTGGTDLPTLEREPDNTYDPNAIKVLVDGHHIGYVPKFIAVKLAPRMDAGERVIVTDAFFSRLTKDGREQYSAKITIDILSREAV